MIRRKLCTWHALCFLLFGTSTVWAFPASTVFQLEGIGGGYLKYSPDGRLLAVGGGPSVALLDAETLVPVGMLFEEHPDVGPLNFSPDGRLLALGARNGVFSLWDVQSTEKRRRFERNASLENISLAVTFSFDGRLLAKLDTARLIVRDLKTLKIVFLQRAYREGRWTFELLSTSDNRFIAIDYLQDDGEAGIIHPKGGVIVWDVLTGKDLVQLEGEKRYNWHSFTTSPDGRILAATKEVYAKGYLVEAPIRLWNLRTGAPLRTFKASKEPLAVSSLAFCPDGSTLAAASPTLSASVNSERRPIAQGVVRLWDIQTGGLLKTLEARSSASDGIGGWVTFSPDGKTVALNGRGLKLWDFPSGREKATLSQEHDNIILGLAFRPDGQPISGSSGKPVTIIHWDLQTAKLSKVIEVELSDPREFPIGALSVKGDRFALPDRNSTIHIWDTQTGASLQPLKDHTKHISAVTFSVDSKWLAASGTSRSNRGGVQETPSTGYTVLIWDLGTGRVKHRFTVSGSTRKSALAFSPDGKRFAAGIYARPVDLLQWWDMETGRLLQTVPNPGGDVLAFSPDGALLATNGLENLQLPVNNIVHPTIRLWDVNTGTLHRTWRLLERIASLAFHPNGKILASGHDGWPHGIIRLWDVQTGTQLRTLTGGTNPRRLAFSPDGQYLAEAGALRVWNLNDVLSPNFSIDPLVEKPLLPGTFAPTALLQSYPNPFQLLASRCCPGLRIPFLLGTDGGVTLTIYDIGGHQVRQFSLGHLFAGDYRFPPRAVSWDGRNDVGDLVASGVYFYTLEVEDFRATRKMVLKK